MRGSPVPFLLGFIQMFDSTRECGGCAEGARDLCISILILYNLSTFVF
jgi:hypothetical protein